MDDLTKKFIEKAKAVHGDRYDYSKSVWKGYHKKLTIICPDHGEFEQAGGIHYRCGCPKCNGGTKFTKDDFIKKANEVHNNRYDYSKVNYRGIKEKVIIICPDHGEFEQNPSNHIHLGNGCPYCSGNKKITLKEFVLKANILHSNKYDYSKTKFKRLDDTATIICPKHGEFKQVIENHLYNKNGCPKCGIDKRSKAKTSTIAKFVNKSNVVHDNKYTYSNSEYVNNRTPIVITCPIHGNFKQLPYNHYKGEGCKKCALQQSKLEEKICNFLDDNGIQYISGDRKILKGKEIDIYLPESKLGIECHGNYWHSEALPSNIDDPNKGITWLRNHMKDKFFGAMAAEITLMQFYEDEINNKFNIIKRMILNKAGLRRKSIFARKTEVVKNLDKKMVNNFLDKYHIQGSTRYKFSYGLVYENKLVAIMLFDSITSNRGVKGNDYQYELVRFASKERVVGGASKLLYNFLLDHPLTKEVISYSDNRISSGNMYKELGFTLDVARSDKPDYYYIYKSYAGQERYHKSRLRRSSQAKLFTKENGAKNPFNDNLSEVENAHNNGFFRIWNAGLRKWILKL